MATADFVLWLIIHGRESVWPEVRQHLLDHLNSDPAGYLRNFAINSGAEMSLQSPQMSPTHPAGPIWDRIKWFYRDKHAQLTADAYKAFVVMVTCEYSNITIRVPSSFWSAEAIRAAMPTDRLLGMVFSGYGGAGHWDSIDIEKAENCWERENTRVYV